MGDFLQTTPPHSTTKTSALVAAIPGGNRARITLLPLLVLLLAILASPVYAQAPVITFNPSGGEVNIPLNSNITISFDQAVRQIDDNAIEDIDVSTLVTFKETNGSGLNIPFAGTINAGKTQITIDPSSDLTEGQLYFVEIAPVENAADEATTTTSMTFTIDQTDPTLAISAPSVSDTNSGPVSFTITYSGADAVTLANGNVSLNTTGSANGSINVTGSGTTTRTVTISSITGNGTLGISIAAGTASDNAGNTAAAEGPSSTFNVDNNPPSISIGAPSATDTNSGPITYTITYTGADAVTLSNGNVSLNTTGSANGSVSVSGTGTSSRLVTINSITGDGTIGISIASGTANDDAGNTAPAAGPSTTFNVDNTPPGVAISAPSAANTNTGPITYTITYSGADAVTLSNGDVNLNTTGDANGSVNVTGSGTTTRTVTISSITGDGTIGISLDPGTATDAVGNAAAAAGPSPTFSVDNTPPGISIGTPSASLTNSGPITYTITYSGASAVTLANGDITLNTTGDATGSVNVSGSGTTTRTVTISSITGDGTIGISIDPGTAADAAGNSAASSGPSGTFDVDNTNPNFTNGTVSNAAITQVTANFDSDIYLSNATGFSVTNTTGSITGVSGNGSSTLTFTLNADVESGDAIRLVYDGSGDARDEAQNSLNNFNTALDNNVAPLIVSATIYDASKDEVEVVFNDDIFISNDNGFDISGISGGMFTGVSGSGSNTLTFTMNKDARVTDTNIQLSYDGSGSPLNGEGIELDNVSGYSVNNLVNAIPEPSNHVTSFNASENNKITIDLDWNEAILTFQDPENYLIVGKDLTIGGNYTTVVDGTPVPDDSNWSDGNFAINVPFGTTSQTVGSLTSGHNYSFAIYPYTNVSTSIDYKTNGTVPEDNQTLSLGVKATVKSGTGPNSISSLTDTEAEAIAIDYNFSFQVQDDGSNAGSEDNAPTLLDQIIITRHSNDGTTDWSKVIAGAILEHDGTGESMSSASTANITINADNITITNIPNGLTSDLGYVANNTTKTFDLKVWLRTDMTSNGLAIDIDKKDLVFELLHSNITVAPLSTTFASSSTNSGNGDNVVDVDATTLYWRDVTIPVNATAHTNFSVTVDAVDENLNRDLDIDNEVVYMDEDPDVGDSGNVPRLETEGSENVTEGTLQNGTFTKNDMQVHQAGSYTFRATIDNPPPNLTDALTGPHVFDPADAESDIIASGFDPTDNIIPVSYQSSDITTAGVGSVKVGEFIVRDGGAGNDGDGTETSLSSVTFSITNHTNLNQIAIYDGTDIVESRAAAASVVFDNIGTVVAADDGTATFSVYVSFNPIVQDNQNFQLTITAAEAAGSTFEFANAGGASTPLIGDDNRIEVTSTELRFVANASNVMLSSVMSPVSIEATDANGSRDLDRDTEVVSLTSTGALSGTPITTALTDGFGTFPDIIHINKGNNLELTAALTGHSSVVSSQFNVTVSNETVIELQNPITFTSPSNIAYNNYQEPDINGDGLGDIKVAEFLISEGGVDLTDADGAGTILTSVDIAVTNHENIRSLALYNQGGIELGEVAGAASVSFTGLSYETPDGESRTLQLFASYNDVVDDNEQSVYTITGTTVSLQSSDILSIAGAVTDNSGDFNRIEVTASKLVFTQQPPVTANVLVDVSPAPVLQAHDVFNNIDLDFTEALVSITNSRTPSQIPMSNLPSGPFASGELSFPANFQYTEPGFVAGDGELTVTTTSLNVTSDPVDVVVSEQSDIIIDGSFTYPTNIPYIDYDVENDYIEIAGFVLRDGGAAGNDDDNADTELTSLTLKFANHLSIREVAVFASNTLVSDIKSLDASGLVTFDATDVLPLSITAADNSTQSFEVRVNFDQTVNDNEQFTVEILAVGQNFLKSRFAFPDGADGAGGAITNISGNPDNNKIEVLASKFTYTTPHPVGVSIDTPYGLLGAANPVLEARDANENLDTDFDLDLNSFTNNSLAVGTLAWTNPADNSDAFVNGVFTYPTDFEFDTDSEGNVDVVITLATAAGTNSDGDNYGVITIDTDPFEVSAAESSIIALDASQPNHASFDYILYDSDNFGIDNKYDTLVNLVILDEDEVPQFNSGTDTNDLASTNLAELTVNITNWQNIKRIALFDGTTIWDEQDATGNPDGNFTFTGLSLAAADVGTGGDGKMPFSIIASYASTLDNPLSDDNDELQVTIVNVVSNGGSKFDDSDDIGDNDAGGTNGVATTPAGTNIFNVVATQLDFESTPLDAIQGINIPVNPAQPRLYANDANGNTDEDFSETVTITSGGAGITGLPTAFGNLTPGILDFPSFAYSNTGDGTLTVTAFNGLSQTTNSIDVIHTTIRTLDLGSGATGTNNGIEAASDIVSGGSNKALLGFAVSAQQNTTNEPVLNELTIEFNNPIAPSLTNIRIVKSVDESFAHPEQGVSSTINTYAEHIEITGMNIILDETEQYYFIIADILETADFTTPEIHPTLIFTGVPDNEIVISSGSVEATVDGRTYGFRDINPPSIVALTPVAGSETFKKDELLAIEFNEPIIPLDSIISIYSLAADTLVAVLKVDPLLTSADSTIFYFNPSPPFSGYPLEGDRDYYINIEEGDTVAGVGFVDKSKNPFAGIDDINTWVFKTADEVPPVFVGFDAINIIDIGFDLRVALDEPGLVNYTILELTDPAIGTGHPTADQVRTASFGTSLADGAVDILHGDDFHFESIFDENNFSPNGDYRVYLIGEDIAGNQMVDADVDSLDVTLTGSTGPGVIISNTLNNDPIDVCIGEYQDLLAPINIAEGSASDFSTGTEKTINFILPSEFQFKTDAVTVIGQGGDISNVGFSFISNSILKITFDIGSQSNRDKIVIGGLQIKALGDENTEGAITRLGGNALPSIADGDTLVALFTTRIPTVEFYTDPNSTSIGNAIPEVPLIPDLTPLDKGTRVFSGPGVFGEILYTDAAGIGTHTITFNYTDERGCISEFELIRSIFDSEEAIVGLDQTYCTDNVIDIIPFDGRAPNFLLVDLKVEVAPEQPEGVDSVTVVDPPFETDIQNSLIKIGNDYQFDPAVFKSQINFDKFTNAENQTNEGGVIGELLFTGVYQNQQNSNLYDTLAQIVTVYFSPTSEITIDGYGPIGDNSFDLGNMLPNANVPVPLEFCENIGDIDLEGSSPNGYFVVFDPLNPADTLGKDDGITDNGDGSAILNTEKIAKIPGFTFGELVVQFIVEAPGGGCSNTVSQAIRINPTPHADFIVPAVLCEDTEIIFTDNTFLLPTDSALVLPPSGDSVFHQITERRWSFDDIANSTGSNPNLAIGETVSHTFLDPDIYTINLSVNDDYGCAADTTIDIVVGGLPSADFEFSGTSINEEFEVKSTSTVFKSTTLVHSVDSVLWDMNGDGSFDIKETDMDPVNDNDSIYSVSGSVFSIAGSYNLEFVAVSTVGCKTSINRQIEVLENVEPTSDEPGDEPTYSAGFNSGPQGWVSYPEVNSDWTMTEYNAWGLGNTLVGSITPINGDYWETGLNGSYPDSARSYIYSPTMDLSSLTRPMIQFDINRDLEAQDGVIFEYSIDSLNILDPEKEWIALGKQNEGIEWFNAVGLASSPGNDITGLGWQLSSDGWVKAKHDLGSIFAKVREEQLPQDLTEEELAAAYTDIMSRVNFRLGLGTINGLKNADGFGFDNVFIGNRTRTVLLENFTSMAGSNENKNENDEIQSLVANATGAELVVITYHTAFDGDDVINMANPADPGARALYYGISQTPRVAIDGFTSMDGSSSTNLPYSDWGLEFYSVRTLQIAPFDIDISLSSVSPSGSGNVSNLQIDVDAEAQNSEVVDDFILHVAIVAKELTADELNVDPATGEEVFYSSLLKLLPSAAGTKFIGGLAEGDHVNVSTIWHPYDFWDLEDDNIDTSNLQVIVFIQDELTREVHQAAYKNIGDLDLILALENQLNDKDIVLYPNPVDHKLTIELSSALPNQQNAMIFDITGKILDELDIKPGENRIEVSTMNYKAGIYHISLPTANGAVVKKFVVSHR